MSKVNCKTCGKGFTDEEWEDRHYRPNPSVLEHSDPVHAACCTFDTCTAGFQRHAEDLNPELQAFIYEDDRFGLLLKHPLVFAVPYLPPMNPMLNAQLRQKRRAVNTARADGNWSTYVWMHERPFRLQAFTEVEGLMADQTYWELLGEVWRDSENIREDAEAWRQLWRADRGDTKYLMSDEEQATLAGMPDVFIVHQGHTDERDDGWSWTTDLHIAVWFARRFAALEGSTPMVSTGTVSKSDVLAYFAGRSESEIVVDRANVRGIASNGA